MNSLLEVHGEKNLFSFGNTEAKKKKHLLILALRKLTRV